MDDTRHLVVGAGSTGAATALELAAQGHRVRLVTRSGSGPEHPLVERVAADATDADRLATLARGASSVVNCANPPYHRWATDWPPLAAAMLGAAARNDAVLAICGNLYGYGEVSGPITEDLPLAATGTKGRVRARMWQDALAAHDAGRVRAVEVRGSDYLGPRGTQGQFDDRVMKRVLAGRPVRLMGAVDVPHSWTYTGDVGRLLATVVTDKRAWGRAWHVPTNPSRTGAEVVDDLAALAGTGPLEVGRMPRWVLRAGAVAVPFLRELPEVMHQHERPWVLDSSAAVRTFGVEPTPWAEVLKITLRSFTPPAAAGAGLRAG